MWNQRVGCIRAETCNIYIFFCFGWRFQIHLLTKMVLNKITFRALVFPELIDSDEEKETESDGQGKIRSWIEKREELGYYANIVRELLM